MPTLTKAHTSLLWRLETKREVHARVTFVLALSRNELKFFLDVRGGKL
jgi:hypothetical protein